MKGIVLAGGSGTRLYPLTKTINKSILPVYNRPLIYYPIMTLRDSGINDILVISGQGHAGQFLDLLGGGEDLGVKLRYALQKEPIGIAHGLSIAKEFAEGDRVAMILGDNIYEENFAEAVKDFENQKFKIGDNYVGGAKIILKRVPDPERFGVVEFEGDKIKGVVEKPKKPATNWIVSGFYMYDERVFDFIKALKPSKRGEYEITDLSNIYIKEGTMTYKKTHKEWIDAGTFDSLLKANLFIARKMKKNATLS